MNAHTDTRAHTHLHGVEYLRTTSTLLEYIICCYPYTTDADCPRHLCCLIVVVVFIHVVVVVVIVVVVTVYHRCHILEDIAA